MATGYSPISETCNSLDFQQQPQPFSTIVNTATLPVFVKYDSSHPLDDHLVETAFDPQLPLLIHSKHRVRRLRARCVRFQKEDKTLLDCESDVIIPDAYPGWFAVFGNPFTQTREPIVPHYRRISQLAISACTKFLVSGDRPISVLLAKHGEGESIDFHPTDLYPGTVLHKGSIFSTLSQVPKAKKKFRKKPKEQVREDKYMSAKDSYGYTFFIPCDMEGLFYVLETETSHLPVPVLRLEDIIERYSFPVLVKLVQGRVPTSSSLNDTLVIFSSEFTSFAVTLSADFNREMIFEILQDSVLPFHVSSTDENDSGLEKTAALCHKDHGDFILYNMRFLKLTSDYDHIKDYTSKLDPESLSEDKQQSRGPDISCVKIQELRLFPPSPLTANVARDHHNVSQSVLSFNAKEIKRTLTFDRPKNIHCDIIPIERKSRDSSIATTSVDDERQALNDSGNSTQRPHSGSECSTLSSASQPSLQDIATSEIEGTEDLPPPPPEFLLNENIEDKDCPYSVADDSSKYYGIWSAGTLSKGMNLPAETDEKDEIRLRDKTGAGYEDGDTHSHHPPTASLCEDENGYVIASDLIVPFKQENESRPASYISLYPPENDYDTLFNRDSGYTDTNANALSSDVSDQSHACSPILSSGSHHYTSLQVVDSQSVKEVKSDSKYVNIPFPETEANGAQCNDDISQKEVSPQNCESSTDKICSGYMNLRMNSQKEVNATSIKDKLLIKFKQQDLRRNTKDALEELNEFDFASIVQADDPLERLKELVPQISKSDVFKIGLCLKDV